MHLRDQNWAKGYARQALSDLDAREVLVHASAAKCHRLHFLQMAAERTCKAHLILQHGRDQVKDVHAVVKKNLPIIAKFYAAAGQSNEIAKKPIAAVKHLAREIELLAPACNDGGARQDNTEYPWEDMNGQVLTPCDYTFPNADDGPENRKIINVVKLIRTAAESFSR